MKDIKMNDSDLLKTKIRIYSSLDFENLHSDKINKNSKWGCYNCFSVHQAYTKLEKLFKPNSYQTMNCNGDACCSHIYQGSYRKVKQLLMVEYEYMFGSLESNKIELNKKYITIEEALLLDWDAIDERQVRQIIRSFPQLNSAIIKKIIAYLNKNLEYSLDLSGLTDITLNGIEHFNKLKRRININLDGLSNITNEAVLNLCQLKKLNAISLDGLLKMPKELALNLCNLKKLNYISLNGLKTFDLEDAIHLAMNKSLKNVHLDGLKRISTDVLFTLLINTKISFITLNHLKKMTKGKLEFEKSERKIVLDFFAMEHVDTVAGKFFSKLSKDSLLRLDTIDLKSVDDAKHLFSDLSCYLELDQVYSVTDEVANEISKFKGKGEMNNLCLLTDFAIESFCKTALSFKTNIDFLFEKTSACFINKKRDYIDIRKVKYINEAVAANLARAKVKRLSLYSLENLSVASAELLSKSKIEKIYISDCKIINKSALEKFYSNRNPDGTKKETYEI